jgi:hypothetical protein
MASESTVDRELTGWKRLGIPASDQVMIRRLVGIERTKAGRGGDSSAAFDLLGGRNHELVACDYLR